jgi:hypothetical protein
MGRILQRPILCSICDPPSLKIGLRHVYSIGHTLLMCLCCMNIEQYSIVNAVL